MRLPATCPSSGQREQRLAVRAFVRRDHVAHAVRSSSRRVPRADRRGAHRRAAMRPSRLRALPTAVGLTKTARSNLLQARERRGRAAGPRSRSPGKTMRAAARLLDQAREARRLLARTRDEDAAAAQRMSEAKNLVGALAAQLVRGALAERLAGRPRRLRASQRITRLPSAEATRARSRKLAFRGIPHKPPSGKRAAPAERAAHRALGAHAERRRAVGERREQRSDLGARRPGTRCRARPARAPAGISSTSRRARDARIEAEPRQPGGGEHDRVVLAAIELGEARVDVAAQQADLELRDSARRSAPSGAGWRCRPSRRRAFLAET